MVLAKQKDPQSNAGIEQAILQFQVAKEKKQLVLMAKKGVGLWQKKRNWQKGWEWACFQKLLACIANPQKENEVKENPCPKWALKPLLAKRNEQKHVCQNEDFC